MATGAAITSTLLDLPDLVLEYIVQKCDPLDLIRLWQIEGFRYLITEKELLIITSANNRHKYPLPDSFIVSLGEAFPIENGSNRVSVNEKLKSFKGKLLVESTAEDYQACLDSGYNSVNGHITEIMKMGHKSMYIIVEDVNEWYNFLNSFALEKFSLNHIESISVPCLKSITCLPCFDLDPKIFQFPNVTELEWSMNYTQNLNDVISMCPNLRTLRLSGGPYGAYDFNDIEFASGVAKMINDTINLPQEVIIFNFHGLVCETLLQNFPFTSKLQTFEINHCSNIRIENLPCSCKSIKLTNSKIFKIDSLYIPNCDALEIMNCSISTITNIKSDSLENLVIKLNNSSRLNENSFTLQNIIAPQLVNFQLDTYSNPKLKLQTSNLYFPQLQTSFIKTLPGVRERRLSSVCNYSKALKI